jgi:hypothetical protein
MPEPLFENNFHLKLAIKKIESEYQNMKDSKLSCFSTPIILLSIIFSWATMIFQYVFFQQNEKNNFFKLNLVMTTITSLMYMIMILIATISKNIKVKRWINYLIFYFQVYVIIAFRFVIFQVLNVTPIFLFLEYTIEIVVRLFYVIASIHSFLESLVLNFISLSTVWILITLLIPEQFYKEEMKNTANYTLIIIFVVAISYFLERQQKEAFYYRWQADAKVRRLTNSYENLTSGFVSVKNGKISFFNKYLKEILLNEKFNEKIMRRKNSTAINTFTESKIKHF